MSLRVASRVPSVFWSLMYRWSLYSIAHSACSKFGFVKLKWNVDVELSNVEFVKLNTMNEALVSMYF